jgi:hypothetical protein
LKLGNAKLLIILKLLEKYCKMGQCTSRLDSINFVQMYISVEVFALLIILFYYLKLTVEFNKAKALPDILVEMDRPLFLPSQFNDIGFKDTSFVKNVLENQADMIRFLQERNEFLSQRLCYNNTNNTNHSADGDGSIN